jgi:hypothetical protein
MYKIMDNFLEDKVFKELKKLMFSREIPWYYTSKLNFNQSNKSLNCYFEHWFYDQAEGIGSSKCFYIVKPILEKLKIKSLIRVKGNLYARTNKIETHSPHKDFPWKHKACLFSVNSCDGGTILSNGEKIKSVENRMLFFDSFKPHSSTSTTNVKARININFNYF